MISRKMKTKALCENFEKSFCEREKMASRKILRHFLRATFFMFVNKSSYGFSRSIKRAEIALAEAARSILAF